jgi:hypothetical protein
MADFGQPGVQPQLEAEMLDPAYQVTKSAYQELLNDVSHAVLDSASDGLPKKRDRDATVLLAAAVREILDRC